MVGWQTYISYEPWQMPVLLSFTSWEVIMSVTADQFFHGVDRIGYFLTSLYSFLSQLWSEASVAVNE
jgi:hypothetical protein